MSLHGGSQHNFAQVPTNHIRRSRMDRSWNHKTTFDAGKLIPIFKDEILPSDVIELDWVSVARLLSPLKQPMMDSLYLDFHFFFCPNRLVWDNWERFMGAQDDPDDSTDFLIPHVNIAMGDEWAGYLYTGSQGDWMGLPAGVDSPYPSTTIVSALPFRMTALIWNQWYRDENYQDSAIVPKDDGPDLPYIGMNLQPWPRNKRRDYFTGILPWAQKGDAVDIPIGGIAPVIGTGYGLGFRGFNGTTSDYNVGSGPSGGLGGGLDQFIALYSPAIPSAVGTTGTGALSSTDGFSHVIGVSTNPAHSGLVADLSSATAVTINQLRQAIVLQQILEANARGGTRYVEILRMQFGVAPEDYRLQRTEYLGGSTVRLNTSIVAQTSQSASTPQGTLAAFMHGTGNGKIVKSFVEHGYVFGFVSVRGDLTYQNQLHKSWSRRTVQDFWRYEYSFLGEQAVYGRELSFSNNETDNATVIGYQERGSEYRYMPNMVTSNFRSNSYIGTNSLDVWHLAYNFGPAFVPISGDFMMEAPPIPRVEAINGVPDQQFVFDCDFDYKHTRPMPVQPTPGLYRL